MVINTNTQSAYGARVLSNSSANLSKALAKLSSGSKINSPEDDAAGLAVSMKFKAELARIGATRSNVGNAISYSQTQDGFLGTIDTALRRMSELATLANDQTKNATDLTNYNLEFSELKKFVTASASKQFNGVDLFGGGTVSATAHKTSGGTSVDIKTPYDVLFVTAANGNTGTYGDWKTDPYNETGNNFDLLKTMRNDIADLTEKVDDITNDAVADANYDGTAWNLTVAYWEGRLGKSYTDAKGHAGAVNANANVANTNTLSSAIIADYKRLVDDIKFYVDTEVVKGKIDVTDSATISSTTGTYTLLASNLDSIKDAISSGGASNSINSALSASNAASYVDNISTHIQNLATARANVGANISRLTMVDQQLAVYGENLGAANSRIADVDVATESAEFAKQQILVQSGTAMLAQANMMPQSALMLLS